MLPTDEERRTLDRLHEELDRSMNVISGKYWVEFGGRRFVERMITTEYEYKHETHFIIGTDEWEFEYWREELELFVCRPHPVEGSYEAFSRDMIFLKMALA